METSRATGYALIAAAYIAKHKGEGAILAQTISKEHNIPLEYLSQILKKLVRANILLSKRGRGGGYSMARSAKKIKMLEIIETIDGPMVSQLGIKKMAPKENFSNRAEKVYEKAIGQARKVLERTTLASLRSQ